MAAGAKGYLSKDEAAARLVEAIRTLLRGGIYLSDVMRRRVFVQSMAAGGAVPASPVDVLTDREREVLGMIGRGQTTRQIAAELDVSPKTIDSYRESIKKKLNLRNSAELTRGAVHWVLENR